MSGDCEMEEVPTTVLSGERCHLGEGPTYDAATDTAWWFDIVERRLFEARLDTGRHADHHVRIAVVERVRRRARDSSGSGRGHGERHLPVEAPAPGEGRRRHVARP